MNLAELEELFKPEKLKTRLCDLEVGDYFQFEFGSACSVNTKHIYKILKLSGASNIQNQCNQDCLKSGNFLSRVLSEEESIFFLKKD